MSTYYKDGASITLTTKGSWTSEDKNLTADELNSGFDDTLDRIIMSGSSLVNRSRAVATLKIDADTDKYFSTPPYLETKFGNKIKLRRRSIQRTNNLPTSYTYDLILSNTVKSALASDLNAKVIYRTSNIATREVSIDRISFGSSIVDNQGETKDIKIYGTKDAVFGIVINENTEEIIEYTTVDGSSVKDSHVDKINDTSILTATTDVFKRLIRKTTEHNYGKEMPVITGVIGSTGVSSFKQKFPSLVSNKTTARGGGNKTQHIFHDLTGVKKGDRIFSSSISSSSVIVVNTLNPDNDNENECTLSGTVNLADNASVEFKRKKRYSIDVIPDLTSTLGSNISTTDPSYTLHQYYNPVLTISNSISGSNFTITKNNNINTGLGAGEELDISYTGRPGYIPNNYSRQDNITSTFTVSMLLTAASGNFTAMSRPVFSSKNSDISSWTNSIVTENKGMHVEITDITHTSTGNSTITLTYYVEVKRWGIEDVTMELDLDNVVTIS